MAVDMGTHCGRGQPVTGRVPLQTRGLLNEQMGNQLLERGAQPRCDHEATAVCRVQAPHSKPCPWARSGPNAAAMKTKFVTHIPCTVPMHQRRRVHGLDLSLPGEDL